MRICGRIVCRALLCLVSLEPLASAQNASNLKNGEVRTFTGTLRLDFRGWRSAFLIETDRSYRVEFAGEDRDPEWVREIELNADGDELKRHVGERVTASGKLQVEGTSPYYWNGAMLMAETVRFPGGSLLRRTGAQKTSSVPPNVSLFLFSATMIPRHYEIPHNAVEIPTGRLLPDSDVAGCSLNGAGDVLNCECADGFVPIRGGLVHKPYSANLWRLVLKAELIFPHTAQFGLLDEDAARPLSYQLVCGRSTRH